MYINTHWLQYFAFFAGENKGMHVLRPQLQAQARPCCAHEDLPPQVYHLDDWVHPGRRKLNDGRQPKEAWTEEEDWLYAQLQRVWAAVTDKVEPEGERFVGREFWFGYRKTQTRQAEEDQLGRKRIWQGRSSQVSGLQESLVQGHPDPNSSAGLAPGAPVSALLRVSQHLIWTNT